MVIDCSSLDHKKINEIIAESGEEIELDNVGGQRYIASGSKGKEIKIYGLPGNSLASFLDGSSIEVFSNCQDQLGDTMNDGKIIIHGSVGDGTGYSMRGGKIYIKEDAGYRTGVHMKAYMDKNPLIIIGGSAGSFLGEYLAGGTIVVLGLDSTAQPPVGFFTAKGMYSGRIIIRSKTEPTVDEQINVTEASRENKKEIRELIKEFCSVFSFDIDKIVEGNFYILSPSTSSPYKRLYTPF